MVEFTKHAEDMLIERGFEREFIVQVVLNPDWTEEKARLNGMLLSGWAIKSCAL